jgi:hypothetical protein
MAHRRINMKQQLLVIVMSAGAASAPLLADSIGEPGRSVKGPNARYT